MTQGKPQHSFGDAMNMLMAGSRIRRAGWATDYVRWLFFAPGRTVPNDGNRSFSQFANGDITLQGHIDGRGPDNTYVTGWTPTQADMIATDWIIVD